MEDRRPKNNPRPERIVGQERQHLLLRFPAAQIRWLFFDLGNIIVDDGPATEAPLQQVVWCFKRYGRRCSVDEIRSALETASAEFAPRLTTAAIAKLTDDHLFQQSVLGDVHYPKKLEALHYGAGQTLRALAQHYRIGVIANQPAGTEARLTKWGLMPLISCASPLRSSVAKNRTLRFSASLSPLRSARLQRPS
jgi:hypothetical protein